MSGFILKKTLERTAYFLSYDMDHTKNESSNNSSIVKLVFAAAVTLLPSRCLSTIKDTRTDTQTDGFMKYDVVMDSGVMIYIPNFIKIGSPTKS
jgi:hypothetical protein